MANRPSAASGTRVEHSAGGVLVRYQSGAWNALVIRDPYGKWGLPKGHLEPGESEEEAAAREVEEETGLKPDAMGPQLGTVHWTFRRGARKVLKHCTFFLMRSCAGDAVPQKAEGITDCAWFPLWEAARKIPYRDTRNVVLRAAGMIEDAGW